MRLGVDGISLVAHPADRQCDADRAARRVARGARPNAAIPSRTSPGAAARAMIIGVFAAHGRAAVLRALRGDARADVLPHRPLRRPAAAVRRSEVPALQPAGGLLMLAAVDRTVRAVDQRGAGTFLLADLSPWTSPVDIQRWLFLGFMIAFAIKAPLWPFHTWLPDAAAEATPANARVPAGRRPGQGRHLRHARAVPAAVPGRHPSSSPRSSWCWPSSASSTARCWRSGRPTSSG